MGDSIDSHLLKVGGLFVAAIAGLVLVLSQSPGIALGEAFGTDPTGVALATGAVVLGIAGYVALEVSTDEAFSD